MPKTLVYRLCAWRNQRGDVPVIPEVVLTKPPSAELRPDQRDDQSLPPYEVLDPVLMAYVEGDLTASELVEAGNGTKLGAPGCRPTSQPGRVQAAPNSTQRPGHAEGLRP